VDPLCSCFGVAFTTELINHALENGGKEREERSNSRGDRRDEEVVQ